LGLRLFIVALLSIALMLWEIHYPDEGEALRSNVSRGFTPLMNAVNAPFDFFDKIAKNFEDHKTLLKENETLQAQVLILEGELQKLKSLQAENKTLRGLLQSTAQSHHVQLMVASVMAIQANPFHQEIMLDKGSHDNVFIGQAVLDAHGIMGQVIDVSLYNSRVLLLTDPQSGVPIQDNRTGLHGILMGGGSSGLLRWVNVPPTADIKTGDELVTSGLGGHYPVGYPVGTVTTINRHTDDQFLEIEVLPSAKMDSSVQVLLVWPDKKLAR
jgi:rod shape-determining protein MreC